MYGRMFEEGSDMTDMGEQEKLARGLWYDPGERGLRAARRRASELAFEFNATSPSDVERRVALLRELVGKVGERAEVLSPLQVDYGCNISIGDDTFLNHGAYLMDCAPITIGSHVFIGPNLGAYTAQHPLLPEERNRGVERALPIVIEDDCWLGGDVKIMPGVTIGRGSVIGAGSVVTRDVPSGVIAAGVPVKILRALTEADSIDG